MTEVFESQVRPRLEALLHAKSIRFRCEIEFNENTYKIELVDGKSLDVSRGE